MVLDGSARALYGIKKRQTLGARRPSSKRPEEARAPGQAQSSPRFVPCMVENLLRR